VFSSHPKASPTSLKEKQKRGIVKHGEEARKGEGNSKTVEPRYRDENKISEKEGGGPFRLAAMNRGPVPRTRTFWGPRAAVAGGASCRTARSSAESLDLFIKKCIKFLNKKMNE
jgi:hypothetical protein